MSIRTPLFHPACYFRGDDRRIHGKHILGLYGGVLLLHSISMILVLGRVTEVTSLTALLLFTLVLLPVLFVLIITIGWGVIAAVMHYFIGGGKTEGTYRQALDVVGWAVAPRLLKVPFMIILDWYIYTQVRAPTLSEMMTNERQLTSGYFALVEPIPGFIAIVWGVYILTYGVAVTHDVSPRRAFIPAFVIGLIFVWPIISTYF